MWSYFSRSRGELQIFLAKGKVYAKFLIMGCKTVVWGYDGDSLHLEYSMMEIAGCEVVEAEVGKGLATGDHFVLIRKCKSTIWIQKTQSQMCL